MSENAYVIVQWSLTKGEWLPSTGNIDSIAQALKSYNLLPLTDAGNPPSLWVVTDQGSLAPVWAMVRIEGEPMSDGSVRHAVTVKLPDGTTEQSGFYLSR